MTTEDEKELTEEEWNVLRRVAAECYAQRLARLLRQALDDEPSWRPQARQLLDLINAGMVGALPRLDAG
jgi:hypothetical protein